MGTDKVYSSNFLSKSRGLDEMLVQDKSEERPPLPESRQARLEARMKETTTRDTSFTRTKKEPRETVLYLGPSRGGESDLSNHSRLNEIKRTQDSKANITVKSNRQLLEESSRGSRGTLDQGQCRGLFRPQVSGLLSRNNLPL